MTTEEAPGAFLLLGAFTGVTVTMMSVLYLRARSTRDASPLPYALVCAIALGGAVLAVAGTGSALLAFIAIVDIIVIIYLAGALRSGQATTSPLLLRWVIVVMAIAAILLLAVVATSG